MTRKAFAKLGLALGLMMVLASSALAEEEITLTGKVNCAKCTLKKADAKVCQDVLVVDGDAGEVIEYYVQKNEVAEAFGHACEREKSVTVTGTIAAKDGKMWIAPSKMLEVES